MNTIKILNNISDIIYTHLDKQKYIISKDANEYDGILVRSADMHNLCLSKNLLAIARAGAGVNNIPIDKCTEHGIVVFNTPGANANAVKELVLFGLLLSGRNIIEGIQWAETLKGTLNIEDQVEKGKSKFIGPELQGKTLGVIGLGAIGVVVANTAYHGLGMQVIGYDPFMSVESAWKLSSFVKLSSNINDVFLKTDYITMHIPSTENTKGIINSDTINTMKSGSVILNFSRGDLVKDDDILKALESNKLRYYISDFPNEKILCHKGVIAVPHLGASTPESEENCAAMAANELKIYLEEGIIKNSVNLPDCELPRSENIVARISIINKNITNMVGQICAILAEHKINIEDMINKSRNTVAYTLIDISTQPDNDAIEKIKNIDGVIRVRVI